MQKTFCGDHSRSLMGFSKLKIPNYNLNLLASTVLDRSLLKKKFFWQNGERSNLDVRFSPKKSPIFFNHSKDFERKKNLWLITVLFYVKGASQVWIESFERFSSNRGHRFKKRGFEKNAFKVLSIADTWVSFFFLLT